MGCKFVCHFPLLFSPDVVSRNLEEFRNLPCVPLKPQKIRGKKIDVFVPLELLYQSLCKAPASDKQTRETLDFSRNLACGERIRKIAELWQNGLAMRPVKDKINEFSGSSPGLSSEPEEREGEGA